MNPMMPGLSGDKMSSSENNSKIDILDDEKEIKKKMNKAYCEIGQIEGNGVLAFIRNVIAPIKEDKKEELSIKRPEKFGGNVSYKNYAELEKDFKEKNIHPMDLKQLVAEEINILLTPIRKAMEKKKKLTKKAYPQE